MSFEIQPDAQGDIFIFHYTTAQGLAAILESGSLRFSSLERMNDPRERQPVNFAFRLDPALTPPSFEETIRLQESVDDVLRRGAFLSCFTAEGSEHSDDGYYTRGWARPRNWAQYADDHRGACLVFDRQAFVMETKNWLAAQASRLPEDLRHGRIVYDDRQSVDSDDGWLAMSATDDTGVRRLAEEWRTRYWSEFFFRKSTDWSSESEYRVLVWPAGRNQPFIPITSSIVGLILGSEFPEHEKSVLGVRLARLGVKRIHIGYMSWLNGSAGTIRPNLPGFDDLIDDEWVNQAPFRPTGCL